MTIARAMPTMTVNDVKTTIAFYEGILGFKVDALMEPEGQLVGASLSLGGATVWLGQDDFAKGRDRSKGVGGRTIYEVDGDIDAYAAAIVERGGKFDTPPTDQPWGVRDFSMTDPDGFKLSFTTPWKP